MSRAPALWIAIAAGILTGGGALLPVAAEAAVHAPAPPLGHRLLQSGAAPAGRANPVGANGAVAGAVMSETGRTPLSRARVILTSPALPAPRVAITGADGRYTFQHLPAGSYGVSASRSGYAGREYGERRTGPAAPLVLATDQQLTGIDLVLAAAGAIAGQILDEDDQPFAGATVEALVSRTQQNLPVLAAIAITQSDDLGNFRLSGLPAGEYYVSALDPAFANAGDETGPLRYTPTYYPDAASVADARRVTVTPGRAQSERIVIRLKIVRPSSISGTLRTPGHAPLISGSVVLRAMHGDVLTTAPASDVTMLPDGTFSFRNVPAGHYQILARGEVDRESSLFATFRVVVEGHDVDGVDIPLLAGATVSGTVVAAGRSGKPVVTGARVRAPLADGSRFGDALNGEVRPDGTYAIRGLMPGTHVFNVEGLPAPWLVQAVTYRDKDITDTGIVAEGRVKYADIRITVTDTATDVSGVVRDETRGPSADAAVLIFSPSQEFWRPGSRRVGLTRTDDSGRYHLRGLPPGDYRAIALPDFDESEAYRRDVLQKLSAAGVTLNLKPLETRTLDLPLTRQTPPGGPFPSQHRPQ